MIDLYDPENAALRESLGDAITIQTIVSRINHRHEHEELVVWCPDLGKFYRTVWYDSMPMYGEHTCGYEAAEVNPTPALCAKRDELLAAKVCPAPT